MSLKENGPDSGHENPENSNNENDSIDRSGLDYVISEVSILSWGASTQRAGIYAAHPKGKILDKSLKLRPAFRRKIFQHFDDVIIPKYKTPVSEKEHIKNIKALSQFGTKTGLEFTRKLGADFLRADGYKIGIAQKLLNLHLKYLWCLGEAAKPPHCPVDALIVAKCNPTKTVLDSLTKWTKITRIEEYMEIIEVIRAEADLAVLSIAKWELSEYERR